MSEKPHTPESFEEKQKNLTRNITMTPSLSALEQNFLENQTRRRRELLNSKLLRKSDSNVSVSNTNGRDDFWILFRSECAALHEELDRNLYIDSEVKSCPKQYITAQQRQEGQTVLDKVTSRLVYFEHPNNIPNLVGGDMRLFSQEMVNLKTKINKLQKTVCPPEKFTFKRYYDLKRSKNTDLQKETSLLEKQNEIRQSGLIRRYNSYQKIQETKINEIRKESLQNESWQESTSAKGFASNNNVRFIRYEKDKDIIINNDDSVNHSVGRALRLNNLEKCHVYVKQSHGTISCKSLSGCSIYLYPVTGSIFIQDCNGCSIYLASQQIRIHDSTNLNIHAMVVSGPIIEGCSKISFSGDYGDGMWCHARKHMIESSEDSYRQSMRHILLQCKLLKSSSVEEELKCNQFYAVKDFNWHKKQKSPHFDVVIENMNKKVKQNDDSEDEL